MGAHTDNDRPMLGQGLSVLFFLLWSVVHLGSAARENPCKTIPNYPEGITTIDHSTTGKAREIQCCASNILGFDDPGLTIEWTFQAQPVTLNDTIADLLFGNETLYIKIVHSTHEGNFTCIVTSSNGTVGYHTTELFVCDLDLEFREKPKFVQLVTKSNGFQEGPKDAEDGVRRVCAEEGGAVELTCEAMVGKPGCYSESVENSWWFRNMDAAPGSDGWPSIEQSPENPTPDRYGIIKSSLIFKSITKEQFGIYTCKTSNDFGYSIEIIKVVEGDPETCGEVNVSELLLACVGAGIGVVFWILYCWWRCRRSVAVARMERRGKTSSTDGFQRDVFIVHGEMAFRWVMGVLLPTLEDIYGYSCFVPDRDIRGGEQFAERICTEMSKCRRVLVVVSPCLLQSRWATWTVHQGIQTWLTSSTRILAVVLQELGSDVVSSETTGLLKMIKPIKRINVPKSCGLQEVDEVDLQTLEACQDKGFFCQENEGNQQRHFTTNIPVYLISEDSGSSSPKNHRLSNMITGSNNASRENLDEGKDAHFKDQESAKRPPTIYIKDTEDEMEDPGSPCSVTPFILPSCKASCNKKKDTQPCNAFFKCLRDVCVGDPEIVFWQMVRLRLNPPSARRRNITAESTA